MLRPVIDSEDSARADLGPARTKPAWLATVRTLPFTSLSPDEFEVFCYLLLRREYPDERIFYYGKTGDGGRDILRPQSPKGCELIQCKRYAKDVGIGEIREELAKLCVNVFQEVIPDPPKCVTFYVSRDLTAPAKDLLRDQSRWIAAAEGALREHLGHEPTQEFLELARTWWPEFGWESEIELTERVKQQPELRDEFFAVQKVIDGSLADVRLVVREELVAARRAPDDPQGAGQSWEAFFRAVGQEDQAFFYLNDWPGLPPDQRFVPPGELEEIRKAVSREPLTFLIGPPAAGKTFTVIQLLWEAYQLGRHVLWIAPPTFLATDGPIPAEHGYPDMEQRVRWLVHQLGLLRDASDFISKFLNSDTLIYIEDPFGKRDEEFSYSLHTYRFLDLDRFVEALRDNAARANCHVLVTSRSGLFDRWLDDRKAKGKSHLQSTSVRIDSESYELESRIRFAVRLAEARKFGESEEIARDIAHRVRFPFEIEKIILQLPPEATAEDAETVARNWWGGLVVGVRRQLQPETDGERLLLVATALEWPLREYCQLYSDLELPGDSEKALASALLHFGAFIYRKPFPFFLRGSSRQDGGYGGLSDNLAASHSSITEAIRYILGADQQWLERMAVALPPRGTRYADLAVFLLSLGIGKTVGRAQDAITAILFEEGGLTFHQEAEFARLWPSCDAAFKERMFRYLDTGPASLVRAMAARLTAVDVSAEDAWRLLHFLLKESCLIRDGHPGSWSHPWRYLGEHIGEMPEDLRRSPFFTLRGPLGQESESVRLGAIHAYAESHGNRTFLSEEELIILLESLSGPYRDWGLFYLSTHLLHLPITVRGYIEGLEGTESEDGDAVREGGKERQPKERYTYWRFPFRWLTEALKEAPPSEASSAEIQQ